MKMDAGAWMEGQDSNAKGEAQHRFTNLVTRGEDETAKIKVKASQEERAVVDIKVCTPSVIHNLPANHH